MAIMMKTHGRRAGISATVCIFLALAGCGQLPRLGSRSERAEGRGLAKDQTADIQLALGRSLEADGDFDKAMAGYREAARTAPRRPEPHLRMAIMLDRLGRFAEAAPHYEDALKASPANAEIYADRGYSLCLQGRDAEGEVALRQATSIAPGLARAHNNLGAILGRRGLTDEALAEFRKAGSAEPDARLNLAFALGQARRWDEAKKQVELARGIAPRTPEMDVEMSRVESLLARAEAAKPAPGVRDAPVSDPSVVMAGASEPRAEARAPEAPRGLLTRRSARKLKQARAAAGGSARAE